MADDASAESSSTVRTFGGRKYSSKNAFGTSVVIAPEVFPNYRYGNKAMNQMLAESIEVFDIEGTDEGTIRNAHTEGNTAKEVIGEEDIEEVVMINGRIPDNIFDSLESGPKDDKDDQCGDFNEEFESALMDSLDEPSVYTIAWAAQLDFRKPKTWPSLLILLMTMLCQVFVPVAILYTHYDGMEIKVSNFCPGPWSHASDLVDDSWDYGVDGTLDGFLVMQENKSPTPMPTTSHKPSTNSDSGDEGGGGGGGGGGRRYLADGEKLIRHLPENAQYWKVAFAVRDSKRDDDSTDDNAVVHSYYHRHFDSSFNTGHAVIIIEKIASFCLGMFLLSTLLGTLLEMKFFLILNYITKSNSNWIHNLAFFNQFISLVLTLVCTQVLFIDSPGITDLLLNCAALGFVVEVDNCFAWFYAKTFDFPTLRSVRNRCDLVVGHIKDNFERMEERSALRKAYGTRNMWALFKINKVLAIYDYVLIGVFMTIGIMLCLVSSVCLQNNQKYPNLSESEEFQGHMHDFKKQQNADRL